MLMYARCTFSVILQMIKCNEPVPYIVKDGSWRFYVDLFALESDDIQEQYAEVGDKLDCL
jgi:hypothetical protein